MRPSTTSPPPPDLVFVGAGEDAPDVVRAADDRGCGACVVVSSGFAESGPDGELLQERIEAIARDTDMRIVGPNCMGVMNPRLGLFGTFMSALDEVELPPGNVALISQSGAFGTHAALLLRNRGLDLSLWCTTGNECDVDVADGIACAARDEDTEVIVAYLEGCRDLEKLETALSVAAAPESPSSSSRPGRAPAAPPQPAPTPPPTPATMPASRKCSSVAGFTAPGPSRSSSTSPAPARRTRFRTGGERGS